MSLLVSHRAVTWKVFYMTESWQIRCFLDVLSVVCQQIPEDEGRVCKRKLYITYNTKQNPIVKFSQRMGRLCTESLVFSKVYSFLWAQWKSWLTDVTLVTPLEIRQTMKINKCAFWFWPLQWSHWKRKTGGIQWDQLGWIASFLMSVDEG